MRKKIVCIEDEPEMVELLSLILSREGYQVSSAIGGRAGLEAISREQPDLVLLDLMMPDLDGWEVYRQLKASEEARDIPVIVITAKAQSIDRVLGLHIAGVDDYVTKPFGPRDLLQAVEGVLAKHDQEYEKEKRQQYQAAIDLAYQELRELQDPASEQNLAFYQVRMVTSSLMHDLRSHLALVEQSLGILGSQPETRSGLAGNLATAESCYHRCVFLLNTLLELGLQLGFRPEATPAGRVLAQAANIVRRWGPGSKAIVVRSPTSSPVVECDPAQIQVALIHLLLYAKGAVQAGGRITAEVAVTDGKVRFAIAGWPAADSKDPARQRLVGRIAARHEGSLEVRFRKDGGKGASRLEMALSLPLRLSRSPASRATEDETDIPQLMANLAEARSRVLLLREVREPAESKGLLATTSRLTLNYACDLEHELASLESALGDCLAKPGTDGSARSRLLRMHRHARLARYLVATYLAVLQTPAPSPSHIGLKPLAEEIMLLAVRSRTPSIEVEFSVPDGLTMEADPFLLEVLLFNLVTNSLQAMPDGGRLAIAASFEGDESSMTVSDTGLGIEEEDLPHLFEAGFKARSHRFGLGLTAISRIVQAHGGRITVKSARGEGTAITIHLPAADETPI